MTLMTSVCLENGNQTLSHTPRAGRRLPLKKLSEGQLAKHGLSITEQSMGNVVIAPSAKEQRG